MRLSHPRYRETNYFRKREEVNRVWAITKKEFFNLLKSVKAIVIILLFSGGSFWVSNSLAKTVGQLAAGEYYSSLRLLVLFFGYLFATILSHSCLNNEVESKTIRLLLSKVSRASIVIGKLLGALLFWSVCLFVSFVFVSVIGRVWHVSELFIVFVTMAYFNSIVLLLSAVINKSSQTNFIGLILALAIPGLGLYTTLTAHSRLHILQYLFPYYYLLQGVVYMVIPLIFAVILTGCSVWVISRKDY